MEHLIIQYGYWLVFLGSALQDETFLIMGGFAAHQGYLVLMPGVILAAFIGNFVSNEFGFFLGRRYGNKVLAKKPTWKEKIDKFKTWLEKHENILIIGTRFIPGFRFLGCVAIGTTEVSRAKYMSLNALGSLIWAIIMPSVGYICGRALKLLIGEIKHLEIPLLIIIALAGLAWLAYRIYRIKQRNQVGEVSAQ